MLVVEVNVQPLEWYGGQRTHDLPDGEQDVVLPQSPASGVIQGPGLVAPRAPTAMACQPVLIALLLGSLVTAKTAAEELPSPYDRIFLACERYGIKAHWGIYRIEDAAGTLEEVIPGGRFPRWSPDGRELLLVCNNSVCLWSEAEGLRPRHDMGLSVRDSEDFAWSRDGEWLAYTLDGVSEQGLSGPGLVLIEPRHLAGKGPIESRPYRWVAADFALGRPSFSPDGTIAAEQYEAVRGLGVRSSHIVLVDEDGGTSRVTDLPDTSLEQRPQWSPEGGFLAFDVVDLEQGRRRVFLKDFRTGTLTDPLAEDKDARACQHFWVLNWSPDGRFLVIGAAETVRSLAHATPDLLFMVEIGVGTRWTRCSGTILDSAWADDGSELALLTSQPTPPGRGPAARVALRILAADTLEETVAFRWGPEVAYDLHSDPILPVELAWRPSGGEPTTGPEE